MENISAFRRRGLQIVFAGFLLVLAGGCVEKGAIQLNCSGTESDPPGCTGTTVFPVPNSFNCTHAQAYSNICAIENKTCGLLNKFHCKTVNDGAGTCNCSCM